MGEGEFAELVYGTCGKKGRRIAQYYLGVAYPPDYAGWYGTRPLNEIDIPENAGGSS
jgi:hypothetical protein